MTDNKQSTLSLTQIKQELGHTDSNDEIIFEWYLNELKSKGFIKNYYRCVSIELTSPIRYPVNCIMKTKTKTVDMYVSGSVSYTPDYIIEWDSNAEGIFYLRYDVQSSITKSCLDKVSHIFPAKMDTDGNIFSVIDVKPDMKWGNNKFNTSYTFGQKQAMMYLIHNIIVSVVKVDKLMKCTFTPCRFLLTDKGKQARKMKWDYVSIDNYVKLINEN